MVNTVSLFGVAMYIYLPNGYHDKPIHWHAGVWKREVIGDQWHTILASQRGYLVNEHGSLAQDEKPMVIPQISQLGVLRQQYTHLSGERWLQAWDSEALISRILALQVVNEPSVDELRAQWKQLTGKRAFNGWGVEDLQQKIKDKQDG